MEAGRAAAVAQRIWAVVPTIKQALQVEVTRPTPPATPLRRRASNRPRWRSCCWIATTRIWKRWWCRSIGSYVPASRTVISWKTRASRRRRSTVRTRALITPIKVTESKEAAVIVGKVIALRYALYFFRNLIEWILLKYICIYIIAIMVSLAELLSLVCEMDRF